MKMDEQQKNEIIKALVEATAPCTLCISSIGATFYALFGIDIEPDEDFDLKKYMEYSPGCERRKRLDNDIKSNNFIISPLNSLFKQ